MSSIAVRPLRRRSERPASIGDWGRGTSTDIISIDVQARGAMVLRSPIFVEGDKLEIESSLLDIGRMYFFEYLGSDMVLYKTPSGDVELYEMLES